MSLRIRWRWGEYSLKATDTVSIEKILLRKKKIKVNDINWVFQRCIKVRLTLIHSMQVLQGALFIWLSFFVALNGIAQSRSNFYVDIGYFGRTTINYYSTPNGQTSGAIINYDAPYSHEKGINGTGLNIGVGYFIIQQIGLSVVASTSIRYDFYKFDTPNNLHTFYFDQSLALTKSILRKGYLGVGTTIFNINKELHYETGIEEKILYLQFKSLDVLFGYPVWRLYMETKLSIVSENFPGKIKEDANLLTLKVAYRIKANKDCKKAA